MNRSLFNECTGIFVIILFNFNVYTNDQIKAKEEERKGVEFSGDFEVFLKDLGSILDKSKSRPVTQTVSWKQTKNDLSRKTTPSTRGSSKIFNSQKAALNDVLMMKLVSYYEDKYRLAHHELPMADSITLGDHFKHGNTNKYNVMDFIDPVDQDDGKAKSDTTRSNSDQILNFMDNTHSSAAGNVNVNQGVVIKPGQVEEVVNVMEYSPPTVGRSQNIVGYTIPNTGRQNNLDTRFPAAERMHKMDDYTNSNVQISQNNFNYRFQPEERLHNIADYNSPNADVVNHDITNIGKMRIPDYELPHVPEKVQNIHDHTSPNFERPRNLHENILATRQLVRNFNDIKYPSHNRAPDIVGYTLPSNQKVRNTINDRHPPSKRIRNSVGDRSRNIGRARNVPDNEYSEVERIRHAYDNRSPEDERERDSYKDRFPNVENVHDMDSTRPNVERMRIIIGTSPIDKSTVNMRKVSSYIRMT